MHRPCRWAALPRAAVTSAGGRGEARVQWIKLDPGATGACAGLTIRPARRDVGDRARGLPAARTHARRNSRAALPSPRAETRSGKSAPHMPGPRIALMRTMPAPSLTVPALMHCTSASCRHGSRSAKKLPPLQPASTPRTPRTTKPTRNQRTPHAMTRTMRWTLLTTLQRRVARAPAGPRARKMVKNAPAGRCVGQCSGAREFDRLARLRRSPDSSYAAGMPSHRVDRRLDRQPALFAAARYPQTGDREDQRPLPARLVPINLMEATYYFAAPAV